MLPHGPGSRTRLALLLAVLAVTPVLTGCVGGSDGGDSTQFTSTMVLAPGTEAAVPLVLDDLENATEDLDVGVADDAGLDVTLANGYLHVHAPADADEGERTVELEASGPALDGARALTLPVDVREPQETVATGQQANLTLTLRFTNGSVVFTNDEVVANSSLPRASFYQPPQTFAPFAVQIGPGSQLPQGVVAQLEGAGVGHDLTFEVPPEDGYGNATVTETRDRVVEVDRERTTQRVFEGQRQLFQRWLNESSQEGDTIHIQAGASTFPYNVTHLNDTHAGVTLDVSEGERYTQVEAWPNSSVVTDVNATHAVFRVDPPADEGEPLTYPPYGEDESTLLELTNATIRIRHDPAEGATFTETTRQGEVTFTVDEVRDDAIVVSRPNPSPLGGELIVFDVHVHSVSTPPSR